MRILNHPQAIKYLKRLEECFQGLSYAGEESSDLETSQKAGSQLCGLIRAECLFLESRERITTDLVITGTGFPSSATIEADLKTIWEKGPQLEKIVAKALCFEPIQDSSDGAILPYALAKPFFEGEKQSVAVKREAMEKGLIGVRRLGLKKVVDVEATFKWAFFEDQGNKLFCLKKSSDVPEFKEQLWGFRFFDVDPPYGLRFELNAHPELGRKIERVYSSGPHVRTGIVSIAQKTPAAVSELLYKMPLTIPWKTVYDLAGYKDIVADLKNKETFPLPEIQEKIAKLNEIGKRLHQVFEQDDSARKLFQDFLNH